MRRGGRYGLGGLLAALPTAHYVNYPWRNRNAEYKPAQLSTAATCGFDIPPTLLTNDVDAAREFAHEHGPVIYKPLRSTDYQDAGGRALTGWVEEVDPDDLHAGVSHTTHLFQKRVSAVADLRVVAVGRGGCSRCGSMVRPGWTGDSGWMLAAGMIRLELDDEGTAHGRFTDDNITYMLARPHERPPAPVFLRQDGTARSTHLDPDLVEQWAGRFVAQLAAPSAELMTSGTGIILRDTATGSQAWTEGDGSTCTVHQHGPLRLWDQVEEALQAWKDAGAPNLTEFGMTATPYEQTVWIGSPAGPSWRLPI